ncbi:hypothetical protein LTR66_016448, partial [Elasticomyces elasticus]
MSDSNTKDSNKANLARIRDNQRRSRARRKEYLNELETKYRMCEQTGVEASAEIQAAARKVVDENRRLRQLLKDRGFSDADIDAECSVYHPDNPPFPGPAGALEDMLGKRWPCNTGTGIGHARQESVGSGGGRQELMPQSVARSASSSMATQSATPQSNTNLFAVSAAARRFESPHSSISSSVGTPIQPQPQHN